MDNISPRVEIHSQCVDNALSVISRDLLVDVIMSASERNDEKMSQIFINIYQQLLNEEDRIKRILHSINVPTALAGTAVQYLSENRVE